MWRLDLAAVATKVGESHVIHENDNDIGPRRTGIRPCWFGRPTLLNRSRKNRRDEEKKGVCQGFPSHGFDVFFPAAGFGTASSFESKSRTTSECSAARFRVSPGSLS